MRRLAKRVLIWLRWPCAVAAVLLLVAAGCTEFWGLDMGFQSGKQSGRLGAWKGGLLLQGLLFDDSVRGAGRDCTWGHLRDISTFTVDQSPRWLTFGMRWGYADPQAVDSAFPGHYLELELPIWTCAALVGGLGWAGFTLWRRSQRNAQLCARCRHTLAGAAICPECGTSVVGGNT